MLHAVVQEAVGWEGHHLHQFKFGPDRYGPFVEDAPAYLLDEDAYTVRGALKTPVDRFSYWYDFGDDWMHEVAVEEVLTAGPKLHTPVCLDGARSCPPEDCGGPGGYEDFLTAIASRRHPRHAELRDWIGGDFDPEAFDIEAVNRSLKRLRIG